MLQQQVDLWEIDTDVRCITTNGTVKPSGANVMGGGCAREASERSPNLPYTYGKLIQAYGNHVFLIWERPLTEPLVMFPVKHEVYLKADMALIQRSARELVQFADIYEWQRVALPRPGCGLGGLQWTEVGPVLEQALDDRFIILDFPQPDFD